LIENCFASCKPESNPEAKGVQGFANEDYVTEWASPLWGKKNVTVVPLAAVKFDGLNISFPPGATSTLMLLEVLAGADGTVAPAPAVDDDSGYVSVPGPY